MAGPKTTRDLRGQSGALDQGGRDLELSFFLLVLGYNGRLGALFTGPREIWVSGLKRLSWVSLAVDVPISGSFSVFRPAILYDAVLSSSVLIYLFLFAVLFAKVLYYVFTSVLASQFYDN